ncbi:uncharacterized protein PV09_07851 [Verruconis gallopava]|uniref:Heterokaryon incompatibility domain-containing protein n=1 Tax=Verruconis gallopava TaxID=253628 RepID=A0A0D2ANF4_9PEZI|nr:uncharacterized protein PV09_07851 [Verruconis gallopava]KIW00664.1 hypothetical protein PV09_07851 [Verruconis gallopava]
MFDVASRELQFHISKPDVRRARDLLRISFRFEPVDPEFQPFKGEDATAHLINSSPLSCNTNSPEALKAAKSWFDGCVSCHQSCGSREAWLPTRLIDLGDSGADNQLKLISTKAHDIHSPYMTLSYQWSSTEESSIKLTNENIQGLHQSISVHGLPRVVRDAIYLTRAFGVRYLWVDRLCIVQGSSEDWSREAALMGRVYSTSVCTIAASDADEPGKGCFFDRDPRSILPWKSNLRIFNHQKEAFIITPSVGLSLDIDPKQCKSWRDGVWLSPLYSRGWVLQESLLSRRIIHCTKRQLYWECDRLVASEVFPKGIPQMYQAADSFGHLRIYLASKLPYSSSNRGHSGSNENHSVDVAARGNDATGFSHSQWISIVEAYTKCQLTHANDRLIAISSVADLLRRSEGEYAAGIWKHHFTDGLLWARSEQRLEFQSKMQRSDGPTWSWASINEAVEFKFQRLFVGELAETVSRTVIKLIDFPTASEATCPSEQTTGNAIVVEGELVKVECSFRDVRNRSAGVRILRLGKESFDSTSATVTKQQLDSVVLYDNLLEGIQQNGNTFCMPVIVSELVSIWHVKGLLLTCGSEGEYQRLGYFAVNGLKSRIWRVFQETEKQIIRIV